VSQIFSGSIQPPGGPIALSGYLGGHKVFYFQRAKHTSRVGLRDREASRSYGGCRRDCSTVAFSQCRLSIGGIPSQMRGTREPAGRRSWERWLRFWRGVVLLAAPAVWRFPAGPKFRRTLLPRQTSWRLEPGTASSSP